MRSLNPACKFIGLLIPTMLLLLFYMPVLNFSIFALCILVILRTGTDLVQTGNLVVYLRVSPVLLVALSGVCCLGAWLVLGMLGSTADNTLQTVGFEMQLCGATVRLRAVLDTGCHQIGRAHV